MNSRSSKKNFSDEALVSHVILATVSGAIIIMYLPVIFGEVSAEGAGMWMFLLIYFLGIPLALIIAAAVFLSIHSPNPGLLLPTALLIIAISISIVMNSELAFVIALSLYIASVLRAIILRARLNVDT